MKRKMPVIAGRMAKDHFQDNFRREGFVNGGLHRGRKRKGCPRDGPMRQAVRDAAIREEPPLQLRQVRAGRLPGESGQRPHIRSVNNWGGEVHPTVTPRMRRFAWAKYYQASGKAKKAATGKRKGKKKSSAANNEPQENPEALRWKRLALTKKKKLRIKIPQRQFIGESRELSDRITEKTENEIRNI